MKRVFKILLLAALGITFLIAVIINYFLYHLPSAKQINNKMAESFRVQKIEQPLLEVSQIKKTIEASADSAIIEKTVSTAENESQKKLELLEDLISPQKPISNFCDSLKNAKVGTFSGKDLNKAFRESTNSEKLDPRIQAMKPLLRYAMRLPRFSNFISEVSQSVLAGDESEGLFKKAEFYGKALAVYSEVKEHKEDLESILDRSYLFVGLNKLVSTYPELMNDPRVKTFCANVEMSFNQQMPVLFEDEMKSFLNLLSDVKVESKQIGFNPDYKSIIDFQITKQSLTIQGGWLEDLVHPDVPSVTR